MGSAIDRLTARIAGYEAIALPKPLRLWVEDDVYEELAQLINVSPARLRAEPNLRYLGVILEPAWTPIAPSEIAQ